MFLIRKLKIYKLFTFMELFLKWTNSVYFDNEKGLYYAARNIFFVLANSGCLFLASGIIQENTFLIKCGIFILITQALIDIHFIISRYERIKKIEKELENEKSDAKK